MPSTPPPGRPVSRPCQPTVPGARSSCSTRPGCRRADARIPATADAGQVPGRGAGEREPYYPDVFVRCAGERGDPYFKTDPVLIAEVLSPRTQRYDRGDKRLAYQSLPTLREYLLISQDEPRVEVLRRSDGGWEHAVIANADGVVRLESVGLELPFADLYA
ncbi:MAG: Uma2 family endonuclease [Thiohalocapsa sp.]|uniref:Uma2 family endonuclease n=1 Tax=Thiohalocapsa sp. TaxID=2497641 RepID=UPI0025EB1A06|nr:Uma2 family endonuclease [Thiohalocapsa sp.]MCG6942066.1 Uma2 family endonuclease [Thiohalocapsa sp.]